MSHHYATPEPQTNITDLYVFQKPGDPTRSIFILNVNPDAPNKATAFDPRASYELKIDTNGDARADVAFHVLFAPPHEGQQTAMVYYAAGSAAEQTHAVGEIIIERAPVSFGAEAQIEAGGMYMFFAGLRSDPFFIDPAGFFNNFTWIGEDANATTNVFGIVLEVPNQVLGEQPQLGVWARTVAPVHEVMQQVDHCGLPGTTPIFMRSEDDKLLFTRSHPAEQRARFLPTVVRILQEFGLGEAEATRFARDWLPDVLPYDYTSALGYPNGRRLSDDTVDVFARLVTKGCSSPNRVTAHTDLLEHFPYLGPPHGSGEP
jgi:hypothetical protein